MLIDIPVFISFNAENARQADRSSRYSTFDRTFTMRFDPENDAVKPQYALTYPPKPDTQFYAGSAEFLFEVLPSDATDKRFLELANADPESYFAATPTAHSQE